MRKLALSSIALGISLIAPAAFAQCPPGSWLCADVRIGGGVAVQPAPPVIVQPAPPVYYQPPRVVVVQQPRIYVPPPPVVVYQPGYVQHGYVQTGYMMPPATGYVPPAQRNFYVGAQVSLLGALTSGGVGGSSAASNGGIGAIGGAGAGIRFRTRGVFGAELTVAAAYGRDFNGDTRIEVPLGLSALLFFNPQNAFQVYGVIGVGVGLASVRYATQNRDAHAGRASGEYGYLGGQAGIGFEAQLNPRFSLFADVRGFLRTRVDNQAQSNPEFARTVGTSTTQTTNTSIGAAAQFGGILYF